MEITDKSMIQVFPASGVLLFVDENNSLYRLSVSTLASVDHVHGGYAEVGHNHNSAYGTLTQVNALGTWQTNHFSAPYEEFEGDTTHADLTAHVANQSIHGGGGGGGYLLGEIREYSLTILPSAVWAWADGSVCPDSPLRQAYIDAGYPFGGSGIAPLLPDKRGRAGIGAGTGSQLSARALGDKVGSEGVTLSVDEIPSHTHPVPIKYVGINGTVGIQGDGNPNTTSIPSGSTGGGLSHNNMQPSLVLNYIIYVGE